MCRGWQNGMRWRLGAVLLTASALAGGCGALEGGTDEGSAGPEPAAQECIFPKIDMALGTSGT